MLAEAWQIAQRDMKHYFRQRIQFATSLITPLVWLIFFGFAFNGGMPLYNYNLSGNVQGASITSLLLLFFPSSPVRYVLLNIFSVNYIDFYASGVVAASVMFMAAFSGASIFWDKSMGFLTKLLVSPIPRTSIILGKLTSTVLRSLIQGIIMLALVPLIGVKINTGFYVILTIPFLVLLTMGFSAISTAVGLKIAGHEFFELINLFLMPIFFVSGTIIPVEAMPQWLQVIARFNPLAYAVDGIRKLMLGGQLGKLGGGFATMDILPSLLFDASVLLLFLSASVLVSVILARRALI